MQEFDNIINYLTPSAKKLGLAHTDEVKKFISYEQKIMSCQNLCLNSVISIWHLLSKHTEPMKKNVLILGYFEVGHCKICSNPKTIFWE